MPIRGEGNIREDCMAGVVKDQLVSQLGVRVRVTVFQYTSFLETKADL